MSEVVQSVTVEYSDIKSKVKKRLSIIGKRLSDKQGNVLFAGVTLSSAEEDIMKQHLKEATETFAGNLSPLVNNYVDNTDNVQFIFNKTRVSTAKADAFCSNFKSYVVASVAYDVLCATSPEMARKYADDMTNHMNAAIQLIYQKDAPDVGDSSLSIGGTVTIEDSEKTDGYGN